MAATTSEYPAGVRHITYGAGLTSAEAGRPDRDLENRTNYLRDRLQAIEAGQYLALLGAVVAADVEPGMPVYYSATTGQFERALVAISDAGARHGVMDIASSALVVGVVLTKRSATVADLVTDGIATFDLTSAYDGDAPVGILYLSEQDAGKLVSLRPGLSIPVLVHFGDGLCKVLSSTKNPVEDHAHILYDLVCEPAGTHTPPSVGGVHEIEDADDSLPGWLPADHASFNDLAPVGAKFGYNLLADATTSEAFPPIPPTSASTFFDRGDGGGGGVVSSEYCVVDVNGIWWMTDCYGQVPWDPSLDNSSNSSDSSDSSDDSSSDDSDSCPTNPVRVLVAAQVALFATRLSLVTSLQAADGSRVTLKDADGLDATAGDLYIGVDSDYTQYTSDENGSLVVKSIDNDNHKLNFGHVVEGLIAGSNVTLSSSQEKTVSGVKRHRGLVTLDVATETTNSFLTPDLTRFGRAVDRLYKGVPYIGFPALGADVKGVLLRFHIPIIGLPASPAVEVRLSILGTSAGELPDLDITYRRIPRSSDSFQALPLTDTEGTLTPGGTITAYQYKEFAAAKIAVAAGDILLVTISRSASDAYSGEVGIMAPYGLATSNS